MKKNAPNLQSKPKKYWLTLKNLHLLTTKCILLFAFMFISGVANAQITSVINEAGTPQILEVDSYIAYLKKSEKTSRSVNSNSVRLEHLLKDVQPATYVSSRGVKNYGDRQNSLFINVNSLSNINNSQINKNDIEIITIKISSKTDLSRAIDLSVFSIYPKLKYIYIVSNVETDENSIIRLIKNNNSNYGVFYKIEKES